jgi:transcriptional regulator with XRE-family HTH domain
VINFKRYIYKNIGRRIKEFRDKKNYNRKVFVSYFLANLDEKEIGSGLPLNEQSLSNIENANVLKNRNPYLLTKKQLELLPAFMDCTRSKLVYGDIVERESTVKLILLSTIMNGAKYEQGDDGEGEFINPLIDIRVTEKDERVVYESLKNRIKKESAKKNANELIKKYREEFKRLSEYFGDFKEHLFKDNNTIEEESKKWFEENYPFFANEKNFKGMQYLRNEFDTELE